MNKTPADSSQSSRLLTPTTMSSQSSVVEETSTPVRTSTPSTPHNQNLDLPPMAKNDRASSPNTSLLTVPGTSSLTPPPSSQVPSMRTATHTTSRLSTPDPSSLTSPPPTATNGMKRDMATIGSVANITQDKVTNASAEELREMLQSVLSENKKLDIAAREARMSAAHYKLQHNLLTIESEEAVKHLEVEHDMTLREVELLQLRVQDARDPPELERYRNKSKMLEEEVRRLNDNLRKAKRIIISKEDDIIDLEIECKQLRERIRVNRAHINEMRSPGGIFHNPSLHNSPATPQQYRATPRHTPMTNQSIRRARDQSQEPFAALLLADRVLSQENNSAPSTPIVARRPEQQRTPNRHNRNVQSLSSLPTTPGSARQAANSKLLPSAQFSSQAEARVASTLAAGAVQKPRERRRKSRDSTISASDSEEIARATAEYREESQEVTESQASQSATEMLRRDPRESFEVAASRATTPVVQAKIYGTITKSSVDKRKRLPDGSESSHAVKKHRAATGVGLGIGFESSR
ncbi:hypothetical protein HYALB_00007734 [Hymenoscyphus albidus]|uniref:Uncharacterized protein n=1 Tax=Hymenoscyphus albidus TaxID=595503 RepID=A0A9N9Q2J5_9HELO|nr:hypothetical protein HYALB_00007734 [Hymenoscyphus albidus]